MDTTFLLMPPIAFLIYLALVAILSGAGRVLAGPTAVNPLKTSTYAGGELPPARLAAPGYSPFFKVALFFAVLHLGVLVLATGGVTLTSGLYLVALAMLLIILILG